MKLHGIYAALVHPYMYQINRRLPKPSHNLMTWIRWLSDEYRKQPWSKKRLPYSVLPKEKPDEKFYYKGKSRYVLDYFDETKPLVIPPSPYVLAVDTPGNTDKQEREKKNEM